MRLEGPAKRVMVLIGEADRAGRHSLAEEIVRRAHAAGLAGATVLRGIEGFGASRALHTAHVLSLSDDLPIAVVIIDRAERVEPFLDVLEELVTEGIVVVDDVEVVRYVGRPAADP